jgi:hypothetical protein
MFDSLADRIRHDEREGVTASQVAAKWATIVVTALLLFGGLYLAMHYLAG